MEELSDVKDGEEEEAEQENTSEVDARDEIQIKVETDKLTGDDVLSFCWQLSTGMVSVIWLDHTDHVIKLIWFDRMRLKLLNGGWDIL